MKHGIRNAVNKGICYISAFVFIFSVCSFESDTYAFYVSAIVSLGILILYGIANRWFE